MELHPKTSTALAFGAATALVCASCVAPGAARLGFTVGIEGAPPPPTVVRVEEPRVELVAGTRVYVVTQPHLSYDLFRFGATWYLFNDGYWYRAPSHRGPFAVVDARRVPRQVLTVPHRHWKHHPHGGPPGLQKKRHDRS